MAGYKPLKDDEVVRMARGVAVMTSVGVFKETTVDTQLSIERGVIWMIHAVEFHISPVDLHEVAADSNESISVQLTRESKSSILSFDDTDLIAGYKVALQRSAAIGTDAGPLWVYLESPKIFTYLPPLAYASNSMFLGIIATSSAITETVYVRVRYSIRSVSDKHFFRVAQALLS